MNLDQFHSTYIQVSDTWWDYMRVLRFTVMPLIRDLGEMIGSFHFLLHGGFNDNLGVERDEDDKSLYIHIRLELLDGVRSKVVGVLEKYDCELPRIGGEFCGRLVKSEIGEMTRIGYERNGKRCLALEDSWRLLNDLCVWIFKFLVIHDVYEDSDAELLLADNANQYIHFIENIFDMPADRLHYGAGCKLLNTDCLED